MRPPLSSYHFKYHPRTPPPPLCSHRSSVAGSGTASVSRLPGERETPHKWGTCGIIHTARCHARAPWCGWPSHIELAQQGGQASQGHGGAELDPPSPYVGYSSILFVSSHIYSSSLSCFLGAECNMRRISEIMKLIIFGLSRSNFMRLKLFFHKGGLMIAHLGIFHKSRSKLAEP
jgi:hypothetical protein